MEKIIKKIEFSKKDLSSLSDKQLLEVDFSDDELSGLALSTLYERYFKSAYSYSIALIRNREDVEEIINDTFLNVVSVVRKKLKEEEKSVWEDFNFRAYFFKSLRNGFTRFYFRKNRKNDLESELSKDVENIPSLDNHADTFESNDNIKFILMQMKKKLFSKQYEAFILSITGHSYIEIAKELKISEGSVRGLLFRAKKQIRHLIDDGNVLFN